MPLSRRHFLAAQAPRLRLPPSVEIYSEFQRIDPFGFALEKYDSIGRWREKDSAGLPIDTRTKLKDGTEFDGPDGLRAYLDPKNN